MNRRLPRIALLFFLLLSTLVVFQGGSGPTVNRVMAQGCEPWIDFEQASELGEQPPPENTYRILSDVSSMTAGPSGEELRTRTTTLELLDGAAFSSVSSDTMIIWIESGTVEVTACGTGGVAFQQPGGAISPLDSGSVEFSAGSTIFIGTGAEYKLVATDGNATLTTAAHQPRFLFALCGSGGC